MFNFFITSRSLPLFLSILALFCYGCVPFLRDDSAAINNDERLNGDDALTIADQDDQLEVGNFSLEETEDEEIRNGIISTKKGVYGGEPFGKIVIDHEDGFSVGNIAFGNSEEISQNIYPNDPSLPCLYIKNLEEKYLISIDMTISDFKEKIMEETRTDCIYFE